MNIPVTYSERMQSIGWTAPLGIAIISGVDEAALQQALAAVPNPAADIQHDSRVLSHIQAFDKFFTENGFRSPLGPQFEMVRSKGLPSRSALVKALLLAEMSTGLLMGAQDAAAIQGELVYDLASAGETFKGMRGTVQCREGEIVLRDAEGIIASLFQGPDHRTRLAKATRDVIFFVFAVPGINTEQIREGTDTIRELFKTSAVDLTAQTYECISNGEIVR
ncbi:MAG TPA: phenylalanine--tRNA ligase beta subunit-related protein [Candidatus Angelobacter sp.]